MLESDIFIYGGIEIGGTGNTAEFSIGSLEPGTYNVFATVETDQGPSEGFYDGVLRWER